MASTSSEPLITDHIAEPGPLYWDYRCLVCSDLVSKHSFTGYLREKLKARFTGKGRG